MKKLNRERYSLPHLHPSYGQGDSRTFEHSSAFSISESDRVQPKGQSQLFNDAIQGVSGKY